MRQSIVLGHRMAERLSGSRIIPDCTVRISEVFLAFGSGPHAVHLSADESGTARVTAEVLDLLLTIDGGGLFDYRKNCAMKVLQPLAGSYLLSATWAEAPVSTKSFWAYQTLRLLRDLVEGKAASYVHLRTNVMLERLDAFIVSISSYSANLPEHFLPTSGLDIDCTSIWAEFEGDESVVSESDLSSVSDVFSSRRSSNVASTAATTSPDRPPFSASPKRVSTTPILDFLFGGNAIAADTETLFSRICHRIEGRIKSRSDIRLAGRYCGMRIHFGPQTGDITGIDSRLRINRTRSQLSKVSEVDYLSREACCEWLLKPLVSWNRRFFPEFDDVRICKDEDRNGSTGA